MLLNSEGYWMKGLKPEDEWGFMYEEKKDRTIGNVYPEVWERISKEESGQFYSEEGLFTFTTIYPLLESMKSNTVLYEDIYNSNVRNVRNVRRKPKEAFWKVVSYVPTKHTKVGAHLFLLEVISSMLNLQSRAAENDKCTEIFKECTSRIKTMSLIHEKLYMSENLASIDFGDYVENLAKTLYRSYSLGMERITLNIDVKNIHIDLDTGIPCGLIINELISNSLKYAFPPDFKKGKGEINISFRKTETVLRDVGKNEVEYELMVSDNGIGFHEDVDFTKAETMGLQLVSILAEGQLRGKIELNKIEGTEFKIRFKA